MSDLPALACRPAWTGVRPARDALPLPPRTLLHAGPPFDDPRRPSAPVLSSAVLACVYEGWAREDVEAEALIRSGAVSLRPAVDLGVVAPLAEVVSPRTTLLEVRDPDRPACRAWSPLGSGAGPQMRFGTRDRAVLERHAWREGELADVLRACLVDPVDLVGPARAGLAAGDDLHASTTAATAALATVLAPRLGTGTAAERVHAMLHASPLFFLTHWMAACRVLALTLAAERPTVVTALSGNGERVGVQTGTAASVWHTAEATAPEGQKLDPQDASAISPVIGDSAIIDAVGFGGQRRPEAEAASLLEAWHAGLDAPVGLDARRLAEAGLQPLVAIGMIDAGGRKGLLGRGLYRPPPALFRAASMAPG
jgi:hypothetical protein